MNPDFRAERMVNLDGALDDFRGDGVSGGTGPVMDTRLPHQTLAVGLDCFDADACDNAAILS
jgi:hypothetical protein